jgi:hypothetical protein
MLLRKIGADGCWGIDEDLCRHAVTEIALHPPPNERLMENEHIEIARRMEGSADDGAGGHDPDGLHLTMDKGDRFPKCRCVSVG